MFASWRKKGFLSAIFYLGSRLFSSTRHTSRFFEAPEETRTELAISEETLFFFRKLSHPA
jgi:hypothetical protein